MYEDFKYVGFRIYFTKNIEVLKVLKSVLISGLNTAFLPEIGQVILWAIDVQIGHMIALWKALYV